MSHGEPPEHLDVAVWRKVKRFELLGRRAAMSPEDHRLKSAAILNQLNCSETPYFSGIIALYVPFSGEIDVLPLMAKLSNSGHVIALPVVLAPRTPLQFRVWTPGCAMERGVYGIPHPVQAEIVEPNTFVVPLVGFDDQFYRLGYGGGFYDRTFAAATKFVRSVGIGFEAARVETIHPQKFDIPMDVLITEEGPRERQSSPCNRENGAIREERALPL
jgi:5-formyltetrahydrofolate cyclo-ligase